MQLPAYDIVPITFGDGEETPEDFAPDKELRGIRAKGAGVVVLVTRAGETRTIEFAAGETRWVYTSLIKKEGTGATGLEGIV